MEKYNVKVNEKMYTVEFDRDKDVNEIKEVFLNGQKMNIDTNLDTMDSIVIDNNTHKINGVYEYDGELVKLLIGKDYHSVEVELDRPIKIVDAVEEKKDGHELIKAPMPGKIISVDVKVGDDVQKGQDIMVLEAMKMENRLKSPVDGKIKSINVKEGDSCNLNDLLMVID